MAVEFKNARSGPALKVDLGIAHGEVPVKLPAYGAKEAAGLLAGFKKESGLVRPGETLSASDLKALVEILNNARKELGLPELVE